MSDRTRAMLGPLLVIIVVAGAIVALGWGGSFFSSEPDAAATAQMTNEATQARTGAEPKTEDSAPKDSAQADMSPLEASIAKQKAKLAKSPNLYPAWAELGGHYLQRARDHGDHEDLELAEEALQRSLSIQENAVAWRWLAGVRLDQHRFAEAEELARKAVEAWETDGISRAIRSDALIAQGKYDEAREVFGDGAKDFYSIAAYSRLLYLTGKPSESIAELERALATLDSEAPSAIVEDAKAWCHLMVGGYYYELDDKDKAKAAYDKAHAIDPDRIDLKEHRAEWEATYGDKRKAAEMYRAILDEHPRPSEQIALGELLLEMGDEEEGRALIAAAQSALEKRLEAGDISIRRELALLLLDNGGDVERALELAQKDLEIRKDILAYDTLAYALFRSGRHREARKAYAEAKKHGAVYRDLEEHGRLLDAS